MFAFFWAAGLVQRCAFVCVSLAMPQARASSAVACVQKLPSGLPPLVALSVVQCLPATSRSPHNHAGWRWPQSHAWCLGRSGERATCALRICVLGGAACRRVCISPHCSRCAARAALPHCCSGALQFCAAHGTLHLTMQAAPSDQLWPCCLPATTAGSMLLRWRSTGRRKQSEHTSMPRSPPP